MTRTDGVPVGGPLSGILRKAARVEPNPGPLPSSARFLYWAIAQNLFARLNVPDPGRRRIAPCFALSDLPRRRLRHALKMLADVGRRGIPVPFRNALPRAPFPEPMPSLLLCSPSPFGALRAGPRACRAARTLGLCGCVRILGWAPSTSSAAKASTAASGCRPGTNFWEPHPRSQCRSAEAQALRAARIPRARWGCADVCGKCTGVRF